MGLTRLSGELVRLSPPSMEGLVEPHVGPAEGELEPYAAIDPRDPRRAAVVAVYPNEGADFNRALWCWQTEDGGRTWKAGSRVKQPIFDGEAVGDPLIAYGPDGALIAAMLSVPKASVDAFNARPPYTRVTAPTMAEALEDAPKGDSEDLDTSPPLAPYDAVCLSRSDDHGRTWSATTVVPNSAQPDKEEIVVDNNPSSPYAGHVYLAWRNKGSGLAFARSVDGGRSAEPAYPIGGKNGVVGASIAVGPDGIVHLIWHWSQYCAPWAEDKLAGTGIFYARSEDGGASFSEPAVVAEHGGPDLTQVISMAAAPDGSLLCAWGEADGPVPPRGQQTRTRIRWIHSRDGNDWSTPVYLRDIPADHAQALPAAAATDSGWHLLSYDGTPSTMTVRIYSADRDELVFRPTRELATRGFGWDDMYVKGIYMRLADDICIVGDYVGLAGTGSRLAAGIVLPEQDDWRSRLTCYAAVLEEQPS